MSPPTLPAWPDGVLPSPSLNDNLDQTYPDLVIRSDFDQGASRQRSVYQSGPTTQSITWPMNPRMARIFHGWWTNEISNGADWFTIELFVDDEYRTYKARFVGGKPTQLKRSGGEWLYAAVIETLDVTAPDEYETAEMMLTYVDYGPCTLTLDEVVLDFDTALRSLPTVVP